MIGQQSYSPLRTIRHWLGDRIGHSSNLGSCDEADLAVMAHDVGVSSSELRALAQRGPRSADLLLHRMEALDLEQNEVARTEGATFQDLQRVCSLCDCKRRCARDLTRDPFDPSWKTYCPNAETLTSLSSLPWTSRKEW